MNPNQIYANANALTQYGQQQAGQANQQYQQDIGQFNQAQQNLSNYRQNMPDLGQAYGQNLQGAEAQFGFNPQELKNAQQALAGTQTTMANLPQAVQQSANARGLTGAQMANRLTQQAGTLQGVLAGQANQANALENLYGLAQGQAGAQTGFTGQSQQLNLGALQNLAQNALQQQSMAAQQLQYFNELRAKGIGLTINEQQAEAQAAAAYAQAAAVKQQTQMYAAQAALYQKQAADMLSPQQQAAAKSIGGTSAGDIYNYRSSTPQPSYLDPSGLLNYMGSQFTTQPQSFLSFLGL